MHPTPARWAVADPDHVVELTRARAWRCPYCACSLRDLREAVCPRCRTTLSVDAIVHTSTWRRWRARRHGTPEAPPLGLMGVNAILSIAIIALAMTLRNGEMPVLAYLAPAVLGAIVVSIPYIAVFLNACQPRSGLVEDLGRGALLLTALAQVGALVLLVL